MSEYLNITVYSIVYIAIVFSVFLYTIRNRLDLLCVGLVCYVVYSMYCFFGYGISGFYRPKLSVYLYFLVYFQIVAIFAFTFFVRKKDKLIYNYQKETQSIFDAEDMTLTKSFYIYTAVISLFALINIIPLGVSGFSEGKANVWENTNVLYIVSLYGAYPAFAYGVHNRRKLIWIPCLLIELTIFFAGSRAFVATLMIIYLCERGVMLWKKKQENFGVFLLGVCAIIFLLIYRMIDRSVMQGDIKNVFATLSNPEMWLKALEFNEPRVIIANYDYVITSGIRLPVSDIMYRILDFIPGMTKIVPFQLKYPEYFSTWLMEEVNGSTGVGGTFWGESFAMFGVFGIILFTFLWLCFIRTANIHLNYHKPYSSFIVALGAYWAWYINRLDFNRVGQSFKVMLLCFLIWGGIYLLVGGTLPYGSKFKLPINIKQHSNKRQNSD